LASYWNGYPFKPENVSDEGLPIVRIRQLLDEEAPADLFDGRVPPTNRIDSGDLIFSWSATLDCRYWDRGPAVLNQHLFRVDPATGVQKAWLHWALLWSIDVFRSHMHGSAMSHVTRSMMKLVRIPLPPTGRQREIAGFLDRECERIASAVGRAREAPAALDDHLRHWIRVQPEYASAERVPLKRLTTQLNDGPFGSALTSDHYSADYSVRIVRLGNIGRGTFLPDDDVGVSEDYGFGALKPWLLEPDDLVLAALGDDNHPLGRAAVVPSSALPAVNKADCYRVSCDREACDPHYVAWALSHGISFDYAPLVGRGATRLRLTTETAKQIPVPVPSLADQHVLMKRLDEFRTSVESARQWCVRLTDALTAYRDSLIHEAVTGKLDVTKASDRQMDERLHAAAENRLDEVAV
jgi:type I restriction enzyme S subunit